LHECFARSVIVIVENNKNNYSTSFSLKYEESISKILLLFVMQDTCVLFCARDASDEYIYNKRCKQIHDKKGM